MDKNTVLAIVLSVIVIVAGLTIQTTFFPPEPVPQVQNVSTGEVAQPVTAGNTQSSTIQQSAPSSYAAAQNGWNSSVPGSFAQTGVDGSDSRFTYETNVFIVEFDPKGAAISSLKLKDHLDNGEPVEMIFNDGSAPPAFSLYAGNDITNPINASFNHSINGNEVNFSQEFAMVNENGELEENPFTITKTYRFGEDDYLFEIIIEIKNSENKVIPLNYNGFAYTLAFEPQLGPSFDKTPDGTIRIDVFYIEQNGKKSTPKIKDGIYTTDEFINWTAIASKYFSIIGIPDATQYTISLTEQKDKNILLESRIFFSRPSYKASVATDVFRFYIGPQLKQNMAIYNKASDNSFGLSDLNLEQALDSSSWLGWLESILKWLLKFFYSLIPNYGVAIILLTILIKSCSSTI